MPFYALKQQYISVFMKNYSIIEYIFISRKEQKRWVSGSGWTSSGGGGGWVTWPSTVQLINMASVYVWERCCLKIDICVDQSDALQPCPEKHDGRETWTQEQMEKRDGRSSLMPLFLFLFLQKKGWFAACWNADLGATKLCLRATHF